MGRVVSDGVTWSELWKKKKFLCVSGRPEEEALVGVGRRKVGEEASVALILV